MRIENNVTIICDALELSYTSFDCQNLIYSILYIPYDSEHVQSCLYTLLEIELIIEHCPLEWTTFEIRARCGWFQPHWVRGALIKSFPKYSHKSGCMIYAHLPKRPRKSLKMDFRFSYPRKLVRVWYHSKWFLKLYNMCYSDSSFIYWVRKS